MTHFGAPALWGWMVRTIPWEKFSNVMYYPLAIRETPLDGYPADLELERKRPDPAVASTSCFTRNSTLR